MARGRWHRACRTAVLMVRDDQATRWNGAVGSGRVRQGIGVPLGNYVTACHESRARSRQTGGPSARSPVGPTEEERRRRASARFSAMSAHVNRIISTASGAIHHHSTAATQRVLIVR